MSTAVPNQPPPVPTRRIVTERRQRPLRGGIGLAAAGLALLVAGGVLTFAAQALEVSTGERARVGNAVSFTAKDREYTVVLLNAPTVDDASLDALVASIECEVIDSSGTTRTVDQNDFTGSRTSTDAGVAVARFDLPAGSTTVQCRWRPGAPSRAELLYAVGASRRILAVVGFVLIGVGLVSALIAVWLIVIGVRGRQVTRPIAAS